MTAGEIAARFAHSWPTTSRHLRVLEQASLIGVETIGRERHVSIEAKQLQVMLDLWCSGVGLAVTDRDLSQAGGQQ
jgi:DNA-binding MarR family transcriptional regulator